MNEPNHACDCCNAPPCSAPTLEYISTSSQCVGCGEINPDAVVDAENPLKYCRTIVTHHGDGEGDTTKIYTLDENGECEATCSGSWTHHEGLVRKNETIVNPPPGVSTTTVFRCWSSVSNTTYSYDDGSCIPTETVDDTPRSFSRSDVSGDEEGFGDCIDGVGSTTITVPGPPFTFPTNSPDCGCSDGTPAEVTADTYTYSDCEECAWTDFPEWPAWPGESEDEILPGQGYLDEAASTIDTRTKIQYRLKFTPPGTCYLKVWLRKTTVVVADPAAVPPVEASTTHDDSETYEWIGTGSPCLTDVTKPYSDNANRINSPPTEIPVPTTKGTIAVSILKYSCVEGYEPDVTDPDNKQPNGFPDPAWEAAPP